jgi:hypothetical protein
MRTRTALLATNLPLPRPTDSSLRPTTFIELGASITGDRDSQTMYSSSGATF